MKNEVSSQVAQIEKEKGVNLDFSDIAGLVAGQRGRDAEKNGDADGGIWTAGQVVGLISDVPTCQQLVDRIVREAEETIRQRLKSMLVSRL